VVEKVFDGNPASPSWSAFPERNASMISSVKHDGAGSPDGVGGPA